ncbi:LemA family protein [Pyrofollis japonicus]|uniref:LemA family protein n=1 Tax=Pyrofollis japonicus TaxID=3060460 RepID=UPI0037CA9F08
MTVLNIALLVILAIILVALIAVIGFYIIIYNRFMRLRNAAVATLGQIRVALRKRLDLISSLVEAVSSYARFEKDVLENVTRLRSRIATASPEEIAQAERETRSLLARLLAIVEQYPDLKTAETVKKLMDAVQSVEDEIARHRYTYNNIIQEYNTMIDTIPSRFVALAAGLQKLPYLEVGEGLEQRPSTAFYGEKSSVE